MTKKSCDDCNESIGGAREALRAAAGAGDVFELQRTREESCGRQASVKRHDNARIDSRFSYIYVDA